MNRVWMRQQVSDISYYLKIGIWKADDISGWKGAVQKWLKILLIIIKEFTKDKITLQSSALTFLSILSIVPLVAMIFGISKGFGIENLIRRELDKMFIGQEVIKESIFEFAQNMLNNTKGDLIVGVSIVVLFFTVMRLLNNIEDVFNSIWGKKTSRNLIRKFTDYLALLVVAPILIILSSGVTIYVEQKLRIISEIESIEEYITPLAVFFVKLSPFILIWLLFTMIYVIMPNTKVRLKSGLIAGIIAGTLFQIIQRTFIGFSFLMSNYGAVYGGLAVLPLFFIFNQLSWTIVFIGGEFSFAHQMVDDYIPDEKDVKFSDAERMKIALAIVDRIVKAFSNGDQPYTKRLLSESLYIPHRFVSDAVNRLVAAGVLTKSIATEGKKHVYLPSMDIDKINIQYVQVRLEEFGVGDIFPSKPDNMKAIEKALAQLNSDIRMSQGNKVLRNL